MDREELEALGYTFEVSNNGYKVWHNGDFIAGAIQGPHGYGYKAPHWKRRLADGVMYSKQATAAANRHNDMKTNEE